MSNTRWHAPTVRLLTARPRLRSPDPAHASTPPGPTTGASADCPAAIDPGMFVAGKTIAATLLDLLRSPTRWPRCQAEFTRAHRRRRRRRATGSARSCRATSSRRSICAGRSTSPPRAARSRRCRTPLVEGRAAVVIPMRSRDSAAMVGAGSQCRPWQPTRSVRVPQQGRCTEPGPSMRHIPASSSRMQTVGDPSRLRLSSRSARPSSSSSVRPFISDLPGCDGLEGVEVGHLLLHDAGPCWGRPSRAVERVDHDGRAVEDVVASVRVAAGRAVDSAVLVEGEGDFRSFNEGIASDLATW